MAELALLKRGESSILSRSSSRTEYQREYNRKKSQDTEYRMAIDDARTEYFRQYHRRHYLQNKDKKAEYYNLHSAAKASYNRLYNFRHLDKKQDALILTSDARLDYQQAYNLRNKDKTVEFRNRLDDSRTGYCAGYTLRNKEKYADYLNRLYEARPEFHRQCQLENPNKGTSDRRVESKREYYLQNKDRSAEFRLRGDNSRLEYLLQYSRSKKESSKAYLKGQSDSKKSYFSWKTPDLVRSYFDSIAARLNISNFADWYRISKKQMDQYGGIPLYNRFGSLGGVLQHAYPEIKWDLGVFNSRGKKKSGQRWLRVKIEELLPGIEILEDYQHPELNWGDNSDRTMELDLWLPEHGIGIEYQGEQHYYNMNVFGPTNGTGSYAERDIQKNNLCESRGITLVAIPYWWDGSMGSLSATLYQARPDVFPVSHASPIPREMPTALTKWLLSHNCENATPIAGSIALQCTE